MENGVKDQIEQFNWQRDMKTQPFPWTMQPFLSEVKRFCEKVHTDVLFKVYRCMCSQDERMGNSLLIAVFAIALELPIETFVDMHQFQEEDDSWFRCQGI